MKYEGMACGRHTGIHAGRDKCVRPGANLNLHITGMIACICAFFKAYMGEWAWKAIGD
jgi:hypothetical protein